MKFDEQREIFSDINKHNSRIKSNSMLLHNNGIKGRAERSQKIIYGDLITSL